MCEATTDRTPAVVLKYVRAKRGSGVTVVVESVVAGEVVGDMKNELKVEESESTKFMLRFSHFKKCIQISNSCNIYCT